VVGRDTVRAFETFNLPPPAAHTIGLERNLPSQRMGLETWSEASPVANRLDPSTSPAEGYWLRDELLLHFRLEFAGGQACFIRLVYMTVVRGRTPMWIL